MADIAKRMLFLGLVGVFALTLSACREEEQGRLLSLEPGKFLGANPDKTMSPDLLASLRARTAYQAGSTAPVGGAKKLGASPIDRAKLQSLRLRAWSQSGIK